MTRRYPEDWELRIVNRQRVRAVNTRLLQEILAWWLQRHFHAQRAKLWVHLVSARVMASMNEHFLRHHGSTDVITFDHSSLDHWAWSHAPSLTEAGEHAAAPHGRLFCGEMFVSIDDAIAQAKQFRSRWTSELARYVLHGLLHLAGYDDKQARSRRRMKREEDRLLRLAQRAFPLERLHKTAPAWRGSPPEKP